MIALSSDPYLAIAKISYTTDFPMTLHFKIRPYMLKRCKLYDYLQQSKPVLKLQAV